MNGSPRFVHSCLIQPVILSMFFSHHSTPLASIVAACLLQEQLCDGFNPNFAYSFFSSVPGPVAIGGVSAAATAGLAEAFLVTLTIRISPGFSPLDSRRRLSCFSARRLARSPGVKLNHPISITRRVIGQQYGLSTIVVDHDLVCVIPAGGHVNHSVAGNSKKLAVSGNSRPVYQSPISIDRHRGLPAIALAKNRDD
jgi:hypothetical protein